MAVVTLTKANFKDTVEKNDFIIVDFWAPWCEPCLLFTETFKQVSENHPDIVFGTVDIEAEPEIAEYFNVEKIPGVMILREQASIFTQIGEIAAPALEKIVQWARDYDLSPVHEWYARQQAQQANPG